MARTRREKQWTVSDASLSAVGEAVLELLEARGVRVTDQREGVIEGQGGSALSSAFAWTDKTAPYRVHVSFWATSDSNVVIEAAFEERPQIGKAGPVKTKKYSRLADQFLDEVRTTLAGLGQLGGDSGHRSPDADIPDQLKKLAELRDAGVVTPDEFEAKKRDLLDRL